MATTLSGVEDVNFKGGVEVGCDVGMVFFSDKMEDVKWNILQSTISVLSTVNNFHTLSTPCATGYPLYHCYIAKVHELISQLIPIHGMSDWERGARNAVKKQFQGIYLRGCYFHYSQSI